MAGKRNQGVLNLLVEAQRRRQREQQAQQRAYAVAVEEQQKAARAAQRAAARGQKAAYAAYQSAMEAEAARHTAALEQQISSLGRILADVAAMPPLHPAHLRATAPETPFQPGALAQPLPMPDPARYQVPPPAGLQALSPAARREHAEQAARARAHFEHDWRVAQAAEAERQRSLDDAYRQHQAWLTAQREYAAQRNAWVDALPQRLHAGEPDAVEEYFTAILHVAAGWPASFPRNALVAWDSGTRQLIVDWELPAFDAVPDAIRIRYVKAGDEYKRIAMPARQRADLYHGALCQSVLRVVSDLFRADQHGHLASVAVNGFVTARHAATGVEAEHWLISGMVRREDLSGVRLAEVDAAACLRHLRAQISSRPEKLEPVRPGRRARDAGDPVAPGDADLHELSPAGFEQLVADLFRVRGLEVTTTARSGDGGVDVEARDPDPITGGLIVIQAKRYRATVTPSVVRDLYGVVQHRGATKGILVTTSGFGPGSYEFAQGKPLTLISGAELVDLLARHGLSGRLGPAT
ncbi:restriction endonuclease [Actinoplanes missouriensis]|uniref:restriction endonuclease n=1 Tax=Actinoplanes missouriensis TaxID=1866 RepID=UPI0033E68B1E